MMDFKEDLLQMVWKYQYFEKRQLTTTDGLSLEVKKIGYHNFYEGPDFLEALIKIGNLEHFGHVEVHRKSSDWKNHAHDSDQRYDAVILHVVWEDDKPILRNDGSHIPTLELKGKIWLDVLRNYERLVSSKDEILCGSELKDFLPIIKFSMLEKALVERLEKKSTQLIKILEEIKNDWEEGTYRWLFQCFGFKTNSEAMLRLAESIPYRTLQKHGKQSVVIEAILLGQADLIPEDTNDEYGKHLKKEYDFYQKKYSLKKTIHHQEWKMMGVRPHNFPAVRIAQLAQILSNNPNLFSSVNDAAAFKKVFEIQVPDYWQQHFRIGGLSQKRLSKKLSNNTLALLTINFTVPLWYTYGQYLQDSEWKEKCFDVLQDLAAEDNFIIRKFSFHSWKAQNAFDSQGMLGLYHDYCKPKKCLECKIGQNLLKPGRNWFLVKSPIYRTFAIRIQKTMEKPVIILGAKGIAHPALEIFNSNQVIVYGFLDEDEKLHGTEINVVPVLGNPEDDGFLKLIGKKTEAFVAVDDNKYRQFLVKMLIDKRKVQPINAIHQTSYISTDAELGHGNFINAQVNIGAGAKIGSHCIFNSGAIVDHGAAIEDFVQIGAGAIVNSNTTIKEGAFIGSGVIIVSGVTLGKNARVGAGSVVISDVKDGETVFGNPAVKIK